MSLWLISSWFYPCAYSPSNNWDNSLGTAVQNVHIFNSSLHISLLKKEKDSERDQMQSQIWEATSTYMTKHSRISSSPSPPPPPPPLKRTKGEIFILDSFLSVFGCVRLSADGGKRLYMGEGSWGGVQLCMCENIHCSHHQVYLKTPWKSKYTDDLSCVSLIFLCIAILWLSTLHLPSYPVPLLYCE